MISIERSSTIPTEFEVLGRSGTSTVLSSNKTGLHPWSTSHCQSRATSNSSCAFSINEPSSLAPMLFISTSVFCSLDPLSSLARFIRQTMLRWTAAVNISSAVTRFPRLSRFWLRTTPVALDWLALRWRMTPGRGRTLRRGAREEWDDGV